MTALTGTLTIENVVASTGVGQELFLRVNDIVPKSTDLRLQTQ